MEHNIEDLKTIDTLKAQLDHLCRRIGAESYDDAVDALERTRKMAHNFANDVYARDLILDQIKRQLGCENFADIMDALAQKLARIDNLELALENVLNPVQVIGLPS